MREHDYIRAFLVSDACAYPTKIIFVKESDKFECVFDVGMQIRVKHSCRLSGSYSAPDKFSPNLIEKRMARAAKQMVMNLFMGLDGVGLLKKKNESYYLTALVFPGHTDHEVAQVDFGELGEYVDIAKYLEVMRAYDYDDVKSDFVSRG